MSRSSGCRSGEPDVSVAYLEVLTKVPDHLGVRDTLLLKKEVEMIAVTTRLIEREFLDEEVFISKLDATTQIGGWKQPTLRERIKCLLRIRRGKHASLSGLEIVVFDEGIANILIIHRSEKRIVGGSLFDHVLGDEYGDIVGDTKCDRIGGS